MEPILYSEAAAAVIKDLLSRRKMTLQQLSEATAIPFATLHRRLNLVSPLNTRELFLIANVLGVNGSTILTLAEQQAAA